MKIVPLYKLKAGKDCPSQFLMGQYPRKTMVLVLAGNEAFPVGTPDTVDGVVVFRGKVNHYHSIWRGNDRRPERVPYGWDPSGYAIAPAKRLGQGRKKLRRFLAQYPPLDKEVQASRLRGLVREGD